MKTKVSSPKVLNIVLCVIILLIFVLTVGVRTNAEVLTENASEVIPLSKQIGYEHQKLALPINDSLIIDTVEEKEIIKDLNYYIDIYSDTIKFFSELFDYNYDDIISDLKERELENEYIEITNIGYLKDKEDNLKTYNSFEYGLIEYFYDLNNSNSKLRNVKYRPYTGEAEYVENLIIYFSSIYTNVDVTTLLGIGAAESGYYKVKFMLKYNNVYGGMSSRGLIKHNNIEQGVLSYVRLLSRNYYGKGLTTESQIGKVYCPVYIDGVKQASQHWLNLVSKTKSKYKNYPTTITINELLEIDGDVV